MEVTTLGGMIAAFLFILIAIVLPGGNLSSYFDFMSLMITVFGSFAAMFVAFPLEVLKSVGKFFSKAIHKVSIDYTDLIGFLTTLAELARKEGILSLEDKIPQIEDPFLAKGLQMVVDGVDEEIIRGTLSVDIDKMESRHELGKSVFDLWGNLTPAFGMIGTLIGLILMLGNLENKDSVGQGMAAALITTLYGSLLANIVFIPLANKLGLAHNKELLKQEMIIEGILSIVHGENARLLKDKLISFLPTEERKSLMAGD